MARMLARHRALGAAIAVFAIAVGAAVSATPSTPPPAATSKSVPAKLDINRASKAAIARLPGVGEENAQKIVAGRPYTGLDDAKLKEAVPADVLTKLEGKVIVKPPAK